jgi:hypothetical protein
MRLTTVRQPSLQPQASIVTRHARRTYPVFDVWGAAAIGFGNFSKPLIFVGGMVVMGMGFRYHFNAPFDAPWAGCW